MRGSKISKILRTKFNLSEPSKEIKFLNDLYPLDPRAFLKLLDELDPQKFDLNVIANFFIFMKNNKNKKGVAYLPEYWKLKLNITEEEAIQKVTQFKSDKATSKEKFIQRHGEKKGLEMFQKFQETSLYSSSDEWFKEKYGNDWESQKEKEFRERSKRRVEYWIKRGNTQTEAIQQVSAYQKSNAGVFEEYYLKRGYSKEQAEVILDAISIKKSQHGRNRKFLQEKYPDTWKEIYDKNAKKYRDQMVELGLWVEDSIIDDFNKYKSLVNRYTRESVFFYGELIENITLRSKEYHLDHKYSIKMGFVDEIDPKIIGSVVNLEILPKLENSTKRANCSIPKETLLKNYYEFIKNESY
jgi:hypothetical protein